jgi:hypothetical protein
MRRTSSKAFIVATGFFFLGVFSIATAEIYDRNIPNKLRFGEAGGRDWNFWDYVGISSFVLAASLFVVGLMYANKDD